MRALFTLLFFALLAAPAYGGGWATTSVSSLPDGVASGEPWTVDITVLAHGRTPAEGLRPQVLIDGATRERFAARETERPGVYRARVVFPSAGVWRYEVETGYGDKLTFPPVKIAAPTAPAPAPVAASGADDGSPWRWLAALAAGALAAAATAAAGSSRRRSRPAPTPIPAP